MSINRKSFVLPYGSSVFREFVREHKDTFLVSELGGQLTGYSMSRIAKKIDIRGLGIKKIGHIMSFAVHPDFRRRGIGKVLLGRTIENLADKGVDTIHLEVRMSNRLAMKIYQQFGFRRERILEGYYSDGEDAILMVKKIED